MVGAEVAAPGRTRPILATGFVVDQPDEGTTFPSAGGNSGEPRVQAVYWRCLVALFASARITNPGQRLVLFSNVDPPKVDGIELGPVLAGYGVEHRRVPLSARLARGRGAAWGNVLYFFDVLTNLAETEAPDTPMALVDSDVLVTGPLEPLFALLDEADYAGYVVDSRPGEDINGLTREDFARIIANGGGGTCSTAPLHYGGELFATKIGTWLRDRFLFADLLAQAAERTGAGAGIRTEEHVFSVAWPLLGVPVATANHLLKRIWTSPRHNTARPGDETLPLWHLPAEKRYGFSDLFRALSLGGFTDKMDPGELRSLAGRLCGVPRKQPGKIVRDGLRQVAAKVGLRT